METVAAPHPAVRHGKGRQFRAYNVMVIFAMSFASIAMGYSASIIGTTLAQPTFREYFALDTRDNGTELLSGMNGLFQAGAFFGALCISWVADRFGRKASITVPSILVLISGALLAGSVHIGMFLAFRFVAGMGSFWLLGSVPVWMTEIVPPRWRGLLVDIHSAMLLFGYAFASWMGYAFYHVDSPNAWRGPLALQTLPALIVLCAMPFLPESPRYLVQRGKHDQARRVLTRLHETREAELEFAQIHAQIEMDNALPHSWMSLITKKSYRKRAFFAIGLACGIQFTGVLVINNYGQLLYSGLGFDSEKQLLFSGIFNTLGWVFGVAAIFIIDLFPRNRLVFIGTVTVTTCLVAEAALVANYPVGPDQNDNALRAAVAMIFLYIVFAEFLLDGTQYVYFAELFPQHLRAKGMALGMAAISLMNVMWLQTAPIAFATISWKFYLCFIIPAYLFAIVCLLFYPDTKGLALEEIAALFGDEVQAADAFVAEDGDASSDNAKVMNVAEHAEKRA
ncbi:hypothetical protein HMPREF1624_08210 [Sporothrix schenckii ATCC 58251]|uniref:Major facilitator superfamily (MFS) profile domain-containing protein n=1 Tax=Sporothrix schenckii (strain ATCC 58251 / de Perez 2211183) TaxID=1391915 RepID=U7PIG1_SPOS1|nr:hypothetical protein HMPREF1624_08210 [Sporothrix schenckii ATCC 58251]